MAGISASNRSRNPAGRESNCSWRVHTGGGKRGVRNAKIGNVLAYGQGTNGAMAKRRPWMESTHQIGPEIPLHGILMAVTRCGTGKKELTRNSIDLACGRPTSSGMEKWIEHIEKVQKCVSAKFYL